MPSRIAVRSYCDADRSQWDAFVQRHAAGTFFHLTRWSQVVEDTFGYRPHYLLATEGSRICGVLPLFSVENFMVGKCLISTPLAVYGGICADSPLAHRHLLRAVKSLARSMHVDYLELRNRVADPCSELRTNALYVTFTTPLLSDPEAQLARLPRDTRYMIRKSGRQGLEPRWGWENLDSFYRIYASSLHQLGTPVFPRRLFENLRDVFGDQVSLLTVFRGREALAGVVYFTFRDVLLPYYGGSLPEARKYAPNNFMYWELMRFAAQQGYRKFDFGRSKRQSGSYLFKKQWSMQEEALGYQSFLVRRKSPPDFSPANPKFKLAASVWRRLPLGLTKWIGPHVVRLFP